MSEILDIRDIPTSPTETREERTPRQKPESESDLNFPDDSLHILNNPNDGDSDIELSDLSDNEDTTTGSTSSLVSKSKDLSVISTDKRRDSLPSVIDPLPTKSRAEMPIASSPSNSDILWSGVSKESLSSNSSSRLQLSNNISDSILLSKKKRQSARANASTTGTISRRRSSISIRRRRRSSIVNLSLTHNIVFRPEPIVRIHNHQHELKRMSRLDAWMCAGCGAERRRTDPRFRCTICPNVSVCERESCKSAHNLASVSTIEVIQHPDGRQEIVTPLIQSNTNHDGVDPALLADYKNLQYVTMNETGEYSCSMCRLSFSEKDDFNRYRCSTCDDFDACATCVWKNLYHIQGGPWLSKLLSITDITGKSRSTCPASHTEFHDLHLVNREYVGGSSSRRHLVRHANRARLARMRAAHAATTGAHFHGGGGPGPAGPPPTGGLPPPGAFGFPFVMTGPPGAPPPPGMDRHGTDDSQPGVLDGSLERMQNIFNQLGDSISEQASSIAGSTYQWASSFISESDQNDDDSKTPAPHASDATSPDPGANDLLADFVFPPPPANTEELQRAVGILNESPPHGPTHSRSRSRSESARSSSDTPLALNGFDRDANGAVWGRDVLPLDAEPAPPIPPPLGMGRAATEPPISFSPPSSAIGGYTHGTHGIIPSATPPPHIGSLIGVGGATYPGFDDSEETSHGNAALNSRSTAAAGVTDWVCGVCRADKEHEHPRHRCGTCENFDVCDRRSCLQSHAHPLKVVPYDAEFKSSCVKCCRSNVTNRWLCHTCDGDVSFCNKCIRKTLKIANALSDWTGTDWDAATDFVHDCLDASPHHVPRHRTFTYWSYKYCIMEDEDLRSRLVRLVERGIEHRQTTLHVLWVFLCSTSLPKTSLARVRISEEINAVCRGMMARRRGEFTSAERNFVKFCLAFCYPTRYGELFDELQATAREVLDELTRPLIIMYEDMVRRNSPLITIHHTLTDDHYNFDVQAQQHILPPEMMTEVLEWYDHEKIDDIKATKAKDFCEKWEFHWERVLKLRMKDGKFHAGRITLNMFKEIAEELQHSFQNVIARIFEENRSRLNMSLVSEDHDVGPRAPEPKTISRAQHKSFREFSNRPNPREGYILDFLRAAVVCESEEEAIGFFQICTNEAFMGQIIQVTNGFDRDSPTNFGYRALHLNVIFESPSLARARKGRKMIMEIQIILRDFLRIRKKMHLYNKIVRAREQWAIGRDFSKMWDL